MKKFLVALGAFALLAAVLDAEEFALRYQEVRTPDHPAFSLLFADCTLLRSRPGDVELPPDVKPKSWYYRVKFAGQDYHAVAEPSIRVFYLDTDRDGDLTDEVALTGEQTRCRGPLGIERALLFGPVELGGEGGGAQVMAMLSENKRLQVFPAGFMTGDIELEGKTLPLAVVDANFDGRYDGVFSAENIPDMLVADFDGDGKVGGPHEMNGETVPLGRLLHFQERYYAIQVASDGSSVSIEPAQPEMGTLSAGFEGAFMALWSENGFHFLDAGDDAWELPAGQYLPRLLGLKGSNAKGRWSITAKNTGTLGVFTVEPGAQAEITFGPPLVVKLDPRASKGTVSTGIAVYGSAGEKYPIAADLNGKGRFPPAVEVFVEDGERISRGRFEYG